MDLETYDKMLLLLLETLHPSGEWIVFRNAWGMTIHSKHPRSATLATNIVKRKYPKWVKTPTVHTIKLAVPVADIKLAVPEAAVTEKTFRMGELFKLSLEGAIVQHKYRLEKHYGSSRL